MLLRTRHGSRTVPAPPPRVAGITKQVRNEAIREWPNADICHILTFSLTAEERTKIFLPVKMSSLIVWHNLKGPDHHHDDGVE